MTKELPKTYNPAEHEAAIYVRWEGSGFFNPDKLPDAIHRQPYTIMMPPPNVTGILHAGHALFLTIQDIFIRTARMRGRRALWLPGTDHAALATQARVEKLLYEKEGKTRYDLGREEFLRRVNDFALSSQKIILSQMRRVGASADWSRLAYTLDAPRSRAVNEAFRRFYEMGLLYRGRRIVNWDPKMQTTVSDDEIVWKEEKTPFYYLKYGPFTIATARPETKFGDKYVVMHPDDSRYARWQHGQKIELEWINGPVTATIIKDPVVDPDFGTGVMTITPWHDLTDFEIAERHNLDMEQIIDESGKLLPIAGEFAGMPIKKARPLIVEKLRAKGLVEKIDYDYVHRVATNERGGGLIEPQIKEQWFIGVNRKFVLPYSEIEGIQSGQTVTLKQLMRQVVETGQIKIIPRRFEKIYYHWIDNLRDWCVSRQIWFGHQLPVWYRKKKITTGESKMEIYVGTEPPQDAGWERDPDTLDTWFSSGLWTISTLGWPDETDDLKTYHPTQVLETAYEILFFWVARMILMTTALRGQIPFEVVYLHGLVRDARREKLSKSKGDSANPIDLIDRYGADALRMALVFNTSPGTDSILSEEKIRGMQHFANKIWNIARYIMARVEDEQWTLNRARVSPKTAADQAILQKLETTIAEVTTNLDAFRIHEAAQAIYHFTWKELADVYLETSKAQLADSQTKVSTETILAYVLIQILRLLHPFMPFVTEAIWQELPAAAKDHELLMVASWPTGSGLKTAKNG